MINQVIDVVFGNADGAHLRHLVTESFTEHEALGEFYVDVREKLDRLVESAIGLDLPPPDDESQPIVERLEAGLIELAGIRTGFCQDNPSLLALFDELTASYTATLFKLKRLK